MSRTEETSPYIVRLWDGTLRRVAEHDHTTGPCDLPQTLTEHLAHWDGTRCTWDLDYDGTHVCCCQVCRAQTWVRAACRGEKSRARSALREELKRWRVDGDWVD